MRCLWVGWVLMAWISGMMCAAGFLLPFWLKGLVQGHVTDLGLFRRCVFPSQDANQVVVRLDCGHYTHFVDIPSPFWKVAFVSLGTACCLLLLLTFFLAFVGFRIELLRIRVVIMICSIAQLVSGILVILACLLYPLGWKGNHDVENACGLHKNSQFYNIGHCHVGWAFVLTMAGGFLAALTVGFPIQIRREYPEFNYFNNCTTDEKNSVVTCEINTCDSSSHMHSSKATGDGRFAYVTYHALHGSSRPLSQCTCTSDCTPQHVVTAPSVSTTDYVQLCQGSPASVGTIAKSSSHIRCADFESLTNQSSL